MVWTICMLDLTKLIFIITGFDRFLWVIFSNVLDIHLTSIRSDLTVIIRSYVLRAILWINSYQYLSMYYLVSLIFLIFHYIKTLILTPREFLYISHPDYFVVSQIFSVARHIGRLKLGSKPAQLYVSIIPLSQQANHVSSEIIRHYVIASVCLHFLPYQILECSINSSKSFALCEWQP